MNQKPNRNIWIDVVRGIAICGVISVHTAQASHVLLRATTETWFGNWASQGMYGVELFFFISGWLISAIYGKQNQFINNKYFQKRAARIYPLWIFFFVLIAARGILFPSSPGSWKSASNFIDAHNNGGWAMVFLMVITFTLWLSSELWNSLIPGGWSIQVEVGHYLIYPLLKRIKRIKILMILTSISLLTLLLAYFRPTLPGIFEDVSTTWLRFDIYSTFFYFLLGVSSQYLVSKLSDGISVRNLLDGFSFTELVFIILYVVSTISLPLAFGNNLTALGFVIVALFVGFIFCKIPYLSTALQVAGKYSYFVYFSHFIALEMLLWLFQNVLNGAPTFWPASEIPTFIVLFVLVWVICLPFAWLSWRFFERPIVRRMEKN